MNRKGFIFIQLLDVVLIDLVTGVHTCALPINTKEKAYIASMKSDLRNLVTAEEAYFADSVKYTAAYGAGGVNFVQSTGNTTPAVTTTADGWTANIKNVRTAEHTSEHQSPAPLLRRHQDGKTKRQHAALLDRRN